MSLEEIKKRFEKLMKAPEFLKEFKDKVCFICGQPYDKSKQVQEVWELLEQTYKLGVEEGKKKVMDCLPEKKRQTTTIDLTNKNPIHEKTGHEWNKCLYKFKTNLKKL